MAEQDSIELLECGYRMTDEYLGTESPYTPMKLTSWGTKLFSFMRVPKFVKELREVFGSDNETLADYALY